MREPSPSPSKKIHLLPPFVAERIAAGEVIERPASIVKELIENSLDAEATEVGVTLEEGGKSLIEVIDNGEGISSEDLPLAIERHATSKLHSLDDLEKILTLGFRGEALPSIAAVSYLDILSRVQGEKDAFELKANDLLLRLQKKPQVQKVTFGQFINQPHGTRIRVQGLFSQIPARLKFLKSQSSEVSQVREWMERLALAYPQVGFRLISDERTLLNLRPSSEKERIKAILAEGDDYPLITVRNHHGNGQDLGLNICVHWLQGLSCPNTRKSIQIINKRAIRDRMLQQALFAPFRQSLLPGQFPALALLIEINPAAIDVNVHPSKAEIRFLNSSKVFQSIESLIQSMIHQKGTPAYVPAYIPVSKLEPSFQTSQNSFTPPPLLASAEPLILPLSSPSHSQETGPTHLLSHARYVGNLFQTYFVYEDRKDLILVDQHAAHERIRYEILRKKFFGEKSKHTPQALLIPETISFVFEQKEFLEAQIPKLSQFGFEVEFFGEQTLLFRAIPLEWGHHQLKTRLKNLVERLIEQSSSSKSTQFPHLLPNLFMDENFFEALASEACHSAIRSGDLLQHPKIDQLIEQLFECEHPWNCPHGRPTIVQIPQTKFEEWFQRRSSV